MASLIGVKRILIEANHEGRDRQDVGGIPDRYSSCRLKSIKLALERRRKSPIGRNDRDAGLQAGGKVYKNFVRKDFRKIQKGPHAAAGWLSPSGQRSSCSSLSVTFAQSSASGRASFFSIMGFQALDSSAFSAVKCC